MRKLLPLVLFAFAVPFAVADEVPNPLAGVRTVFINAAPPALHQIRTALAAEVPSLRFVSRSDDADAVVELRTKLTSTTIRTNQPGQVRQRDRHGRVTTLATGVPFVHRPTMEQRPTLVMDGVAGLVIRGGEESILYSGVSSPFGVEQFARAFGKAWRAAN